MENKTKRRKRTQPSTYRAVTEKRWAGRPAQYTYDVCIVHVQYKDRGRTAIAVVKRFPLGLVTRQEASEARRNLLDIFLMEHG